MYIYIYIHMYLYACLTSACLVLKPTSWHGQAVESRLGKLYHSRGTAHLLCSRPLRRISRRQSRAFSVWACIAGACSPPGSTIQVLVGKHRRSSWSGAAILPSPSTAVGFDHSGHACVYARSPGKASVCSGVRRQHQFQILRNTVSGAMSKPLRAPVYCLALVDVYIYI